MPFSTAVMLVANPPVEKTYVCVLCQSKWLDYNEYVKMPFCIRDAQRKPVQVSVTLCVCLLCVCVSQSGWIQIRELAGLGVGVEGGGGLGCPFPQ